MAKNINIGRIIENEYGVSVALGNKSDNPEYNLNVEVVVKDGHGKVLHKAVNGFINIQDPRTLHDELLAAGKITEEVHGQMKERARKISDKVKYNLVVPRK